MIYTFPVGHSKKSKLLEQEEFPIFKSLSLRKKCPYSELSWSVLPRIRTEYGETLRISSYPVQMWENTDQNNFKYGYFWHSV